MVVQSRNGSLLVGRVYDTVALWLYSMVRPPFQKLCHMRFLSASSRRPLSSSTQARFSAVKSRFSERVKSQRRLYVRSKVKYLSYVSGIRFLGVPTARGR